MSRQWTLRLIDSDDPILRRKGKDAVSPIALLENLPQLKALGLDRFLVLVPPPALIRPPLHDDRKRAVRPPLLGQTGEHKGRSAPVPVGEVSSTREEIAGTNEILLPEDGSLGVLCPMPWPNQSLTDRLCALMVGPSNAGKSTLAAKLMEIWAALPKNDGKPMYVFSRLANDPALRYIVPEPTYCDIDNKAEMLGMTIEDFANSFVLFDDVESVDDKEVRDHLRELRDKCLEAGRKLHIEMAVCGHLGLDYQKTRKPLNESTLICLFPRSGAGTSVTGICKRYLGMSDKEIERIKHFSGERGWAVIGTVAPRWVLHENGCYIMD